MDPRSNVWPDIAPAARLMAGILADDMGWISRRVEDFYPYERVGDKRKVSLDIDMGALQRRAGEAGWHAESIPIPLGWMEKGLTIDLSVRLDDAPLSVWRRHRDSEMGRAAILATLPAEVAHDVSLECAEALYDICYAMPSQADRDAVERRLFPPLWQRHSDEVCDWLARCCRCERFAERLRLHTLNYMPIVEIPARWDEPELRNTIVKFDILTGPVEWERSTFQPFLREPLAAKVKIMRDLEAQSEHLHVHMPDGVEVAGLPQAQVPQHPDDAEAATSSPQASSDMYGLISWDSAAIYRARRTSTEDYFLRIPVLPQIEGFGPKALVALLATALPILGLLVGCLCGKPLPDLLDALFGQTASSFILLGASLVSGYAAWEEKQHARAMMLAPLRRVVDVGVIAGIVASVWVLFSVLLLADPAPGWLGGADIGVMAVVVLVEAFAIWCLSVCLLTVRRVRASLEGQRGRTVELAAAS